MLVFGSGGAGGVGSSFAETIASVRVMPVIHLLGSDSLKLRHLRKQAAAARADGILAVGGGKTLDLAKLAAFGAGIPMVSVPTQASHDGIASPVAVVRGRDQKTYSHGTRPPIAVVVPLHVIARAPRRTIVSGMSDLVANLAAVADWEWSRDHLGEPLDDYSALLARCAAEMIVSRRHLYTPECQFSEEDAEALVHGLVLSGLAMTVAGSSRPCSGPEHLFSHALEAVCGSNSLHGEQVAVGVVLASAFYPERLATTLALLRQIGAPRCPTDIGVTMDQALQAVRLIPSVRPHRRTQVSEAVKTDSVFVCKEALAAWEG
jgi:glycerol-1-phosphate dehydrogenase [NAD(P)+]